MNECVDLVLEASRLRDENAELHAEIERLTTNNHKLMLWNEQLQAELDIARRGLEEE